MIRVSIAAAALALLAATNPGAAQTWDYGYNNAIQHQSGTYDTYKPSYYGYRYGYKPSYNYYNSYKPSYSYEYGHKYGYSRYGYGYRCTYNCY
jgi:hypothetical protein